MQGATFADCTLLLLDRRYLLIKADDVRFFALPALVIAIRKTPFLLSHATLASFESMGRRGSEGMKDDLLSTTETMRNLTVIAYTDESLQSFQQ